MGVSIAGADLFVSEYAKTGSSVSCWKFEVRSNLPPSPPCGKRADPPIPLLYSTLPTPHSLAINSHPLVYQLWCLEFTPAGHIF